MAKSNAPRTRKRAGKVVVSETEEKENDTNTEGTEEEDVPTKSTETAGEQEQEDEAREEAKDEQACQVDSSDLVSGEQDGTPTVTMTWETEENEEGEGDVNGKRKAESANDSTPSKKKKSLNDGFCLFVGNLNNSKKYEEVKDSLASYFMTQSLLVQDIKLDCSRKYAYVEFASEMDLTKALTLNGAMVLERPVRITKPEMKSEAMVKDQPEDSRACQMDAPDPVSGEQDSTPTVTVTWETEENEEGEVVNGKRKAESAVESSPSKKAKTINDGFCLFVGNLNNSKKYEEVKNSLASYFLTQSLMVQCIRLDRSKKFAYVDLFSEMDLTKGLTLNGEMMLEKPMRIAKAKVKNVDKVKVKTSSKNKNEARNARCLFLKNVPYTATEEDILKIFTKAVAVRFPGGTEGPSQGIAFVEFSDKTIAEKFLKKRQGTKMQDRVLIVEHVGEKSAYKAKEAPATVEAPPSTTLFVNNLSYNVKEKHLKSVFNKAVKINIPQSKGKSKGFAFVEFGNVKDAIKALESSQNTEICKRAIRVEFSEIRAKPASETVVVLSKTLIVMGLAEQTTEETLKSAFEEAISARIPVNKITGVSKGFGFLDFENEEDCKAAKDAMEDCEIDGSKVTVAYARPKVEGSQQGNSGGSAGVSPRRPGDNRRGGSFRGARGRTGGRGRGRGAGPATKAQHGAKGGKNKG